MFENNPLQKLSTFLLALVVVLVAACAGDDGAPGPQGDTGAPGTNGTNGENGKDGKDAVSTLGYFQGTVAGHRQDGTAFSEAFNFEYLSGDDSGSETEWLFQRFETAEGAIVNATITSEAITKGQQPALNVPLDNGYLKMTTTPEQDGVIDPTALFFSFSKGLNENQIFRLTAQPYLEDINYKTLAEISPEANGVYKFALSATGHVMYNPTDVDGDEKIESNEVTRRLSSGDQYAFYYDVETGELLSIFFNYEQIEDAALFDKYDDVKFVPMENESKEIYYVFVKASDDSPLYEDIGIVDADKITITNFKREGGVISFDFSITISKYRGFIGHYIPGPLPTKQDGLNTTGHDLSITGKFNSGGKYYTEEIGRKRG
jgi:hypothetical protein